MSQTEKEDNSNNRSEGNGHSRKIQKLVDYRRDQMFSLSLKGYSQSTIANVLNVSQGLISSDIAYLRQKAKEALADYLK